MSSPTCTSSEFLTRSSCPRPPLTGARSVQGNHKQIIREIGAASNVLLKNVKSTLPLDLKKNVKIGIFGSDAGPHPAGPNGCTTGAGECVYSRQFSCWSLTH